MKAQELRIGNLVNYKYWNPNPKNPNWEYGVVKIVGVVRDSFYFTKLNKNSICRIGELHPIPLTEEWLATFGAKEKYSDTMPLYVINLLNNRNIAFRKITNRFLDEGLLEQPFYRCDGLCDIYYVHQLQNLYFALTNEELELNTERNGSNSSICK